MDIDASSTPEQLQSLRGGTAPGYLDNWSDGDVAISDSEGASPYFVDSVFQEIYSREYGSDPERAQRWLANDIISTKIGVKSKAVKPIWVPLYGYQGVVWFQANVLNSFVDAVDRLLCLDVRAGVTYNLYVFDKRDDYADANIRDAWLAGRDRNGLTVSAKGVGDYTSDQFAWSWAAATLGLRVQDNRVSQNVGEKILFVAGPEDPIPWNWEPVPEHRTMKVALSWATDRTQNRPDIAYLRFPENPRSACWTNQYGSYITQIARVLTPGRIPNRPGQPAIPDAFFGLEDLSNKSATYGGLSSPPKLWNEIVSRWEENNDAVVYLRGHGYKEKKSSVKVKVSDRWHLHFPGLGLPYTAKLGVQAKGQYILHSELGDPLKIQDRILGLVDNLESGSKPSQVQTLEVYLPGTGYFFPLAGPTDLVVNLESREEEDLDLAFLTLANRLKEWRDYLKSLTEKDIPFPAESGLSVFPQFITLRPVYKGYTLRDVDSPDSEPISWDLKTTTIEDFRKLAGTIWKEGKLMKDGQTKTYKQETAWIGIHQGSQDKSAKGGKKVSRAVSKPKLLVSPFADEEEWKHIRKLIVDPNVSISLLDSSADPIFGDEDFEQPFGFRVIYDTETSLLYRKTDRANLPPHTHHYDYQLNNENATVELMTVSPKEHQLGEHLTPDYELKSSQDFILQIPEKEFNSFVNNNKNNDMNMAMSISEDVQTYPRGPHLRELSYTQPLSVQTNQALPMNAPPVEPLLNLGSSSLPIVSLSVLTPTEVRKLQINFTHMRNMLLSRSEKCPYEGCGAIIALRDPNLMRQHLKDEHSHFSTATTPDPTPEPDDQQPGAQQPAPQQPAAQQPAAQQPAPQQPAPQQPAAQQPVPQQPAAQDPPPPGPIPFSPPTPLIAPRTPPNQIMNDLLGDSPQTKTPNLSPSDPRQVYPPPSPICF
ncbi:hypothetical protein QBC44DRAFT_234386 [Cladorrhinum sp. PSN332]|nr:hypothetical protein QBC44DRAFT_234386 [Cladorrhinum sp. PSN332]